MADTPTHSDIPDLTNLIITLDTFPEYLEDTPVVFTIHHRWTYVNLDKVDFAPILALFESLLPLAEQLAEWSDEGQIGDWERDEWTNEPVEDGQTGEWIREGEFGDTGAELLQQIAEQWSKIHLALVHNHLRHGDAKFLGKDQCRRAVVRCIRDLA